MTAGRNALVFGASGGIGRSVAAALGRDFDIVFVTSRSDDRAQATSEQLQRSDGASYVGMSCDIGDAASITACVADATVSGSLEVVVIASGQLVLGPLADLTEEMWRSAFDTNLVGPCVVTSAVVPALQAAAHGRLIILSSASGVTGLAGRGAYAASKAGLHGLIRVAAAELGPYGATANVVAPGPIDTEMVAAAATVVPDYRANLEGQIPAGRYGSPDEVAALTTFLASPESAYINGQVLIVDGGWTATHTAALPPVST